MEDTKMPSLPKGLPPVEERTKTTYTAYIVNKHWKKVEDALKADEDVLILEGVPKRDEKTETIAVFVTNATTKFLQSIQKQAQKQVLTENAQE